MTGKKAVLTLVLGALTAGVPAFAQQSVEWGSNVAVQYFGSFQKQTTDHGVRHDATNSGGVLATYRHFFNRYNGVEANYGYTLNNQNYALGAVTSGLKTHAHEATAAYVFRVPMRGWTPFALAGGGAVVFRPDLTGIDSQARAAFVYGGGVDMDLATRWFLRAQYRGLVYNSPVLGVATVASERITHQAEPSIGLGFRF